MLTLSRPLPCPYLYLPLLCIEPLLSILTFNALSNAHVQACALQHKLIDSTLLHKALLQCVLLVCLSLAFFSLQISSLTSQSTCYREDFSKHTSAFVESSPCLSRALSCNIAPVQGVSGR